MVKKSEKMKKDPRLLAGLFLNINYIKKSTFTLLFDI